ncbi:acyl-CoA dehydrogenase family protein [Malikia spinosa]|uniref:Medium-chain specific acyl-CoA dehydrogenase, mitochondrial n=1 Tax=Malikia spinosa TaxID=86180 RepID=A0A7C9IXF3_9BURK|nr:acyl-CoA dehydrogenase family protein [Malikia spinosa]MYZ51307.1 acyl-CoA dehydrogenase [Malikia spinosa]OGB72649.1 MAG: acyl-CoA dehydrogenase [Burkholderiales bacterium RIFOXYC12_FULL_65_23]
MDFSLNDEQKMMIDTIRRFIAEDLQPLENEVEEKGYLEPEKAAAIHAKGKELGLYALNMPAELGGGGLSNMDRILCEEQFGHTTDILVRRAFGNVYEPLLHCKGEQVERWLKPAIEGKRTCAITITESGAGSDAAGIKTHAKRNEQGQWVLNGSKHFISDGEWSDFFLVSAKTGEKEISMFMVDKGLPGFTVGKDQKMMGLRGTPHLELFFDNVVLEDATLLGEQGQGFKLAMGALNVVRLAQVGARAVGKATHVCEMMLDYANDRKQFNTRIGDFQMVQQMLADSVIEINAARWMVYQAAWMLDQGLDAREQIAMVKVHAAETLGRVVDRAVQVFGGMGFCKELSIERYYRDARIYRIYDGTSEIHRGVIAKSALKKGAALFDVNR